MKRDVGIRDNSSYSDINTNALFLVLATRYKVNCGVNDWKSNSRGWSLQASGNDGHHYEASESNYLTLVHIPLMPIEENMMNSAI